ncbi:hypothetical protein PCANC_17913 [Puccinia coronata f. sp. avenae]|uniref:Uncharacterized protein n=1 Tax=Puccinia coronata f. sp. avenae TaxID=200324 RepID=A0A2N5V485_9BASI|nr:hypothetical protein PCANC_17913 [Puccinia coronata f. sp. avenae]PLW44716.1 hypothetical protein PCASD_05892 [Puccinia coronata f. sp. avenae]
MTSLMIPFFVRALLGLDLWSIIIGFKEIIEFFLVFVFFIRFGFKEILQKPASLGGAVGHSCSELANLARRLAETDALKASRAEVSGEPGRVPAGRKKAGGFANAPPSLDRAGVVLTPVELNRRAKVVSSHQTSSTAPMKQTYRPSRVYSLLDDR